MIGVFAIRQQSTEIAVVLKVAHNGSAEHPFQAGFEHFKEIVERESGGEIVVEIYPSSQLGAEDAVVEMVALGAIAGSAVSIGGGVAPFVSEADLFNLPFLFEDMDHFYRVLDGPVGRDVADKIEQKLDCVVLGYWFSGVRNVWNGVRPIRMPADLEGLKIRVIGSPIFVETFNALGAQATPMAFGEVYYGLQQRVIDGAETDHVDLLIERFYEVTKYVGLTGHNYMAAPFIFSRDHFDRLTSEQQEIVRRAARDATAHQRRAMEVMEDEAMAKLIEEGIEFNDVDLLAFRDRVTNIYERNAKRIGGMEKIEQALAQ